VLVGVFVMVFVMIAVTESIDSHSVLIGFVLQSIDSQ
jgi:hypothetical protein